MYSFGPTINSPVNYEAINSIQKIERMKSSASAKLGISSNQMDDFLYNKMNLPTREDFIATRDSRALKAATDLMTTYLSSERNLREDIFGNQNLKQEQKKKGLGNQLKVAGVMSLYGLGIAFGVPVAFDLTNGDDQSQSAYAYGDCTFYVDESGINPLPNSFSNKDFALANYGQVLTDIGYAKQQLTTVHWGFDRSESQAYVPDVIEAKGGIQDAIKHYENCIPHSMRPLLGFDNTIPQDLAKIDVALSTPPSNVLIKPLPDWATGSPSYPNVNMSNIITSDQYFAGQISDMYKVESKINDQIAKINSGEVSDLDIPDPTISQPPLVFFERVIAPPVIGGAVVGLGFYIYNIAVDLRNYLKGK